MTPRLLPHRLSKKLVMLMLCSALVAPVAVAQTTMDSLCAVNAHSNRVNVTTGARAIATKARGSTVRVDTPDGYGTGFILAPDNVVVTAYHVVRDAKSWTVTTSTRHEYTASLVGFNEVRDLAVLKVDWGKVAPVGLNVETNAPKAGDAVIALGNSCDGFDAARYGQITVLEKDLGKTFPGQMIQSNLPLAPGDSGGPVINLNGRVIGVSDAIEADQGGISSFVAPLYNARDALASVKAGEQREVPFIGVGLQDLTADAVSRIGAGVSGILVMSVTPGSGAAKAGLKGADLTNVQSDADLKRTVQSADIITALDGRVVSTSEDLIGELRAHKVGDKVTLTVHRAGQNVSVTITLGSRRATL